MKRDGGPVFPAHAKTGHPHGPFRGLPANENARALISMVAQSTRSNQRPDTLMQDRRADRSTKPSCDARPDHTFGSKPAPMLSARMSVSANSGHEFDHLQQGASVIYARYAHIVCTISRRYRTQRNNYCFEK